MAVQKLTKRSVEALQAEVGRDVFAWDSTLPGFGVRVKPSGVRSYVLQYRNAHGRSKRATIGRHGKLTVDQAKRRARQLFALVGNGKDPVTENNTARVAPIVNDLMDRYISEHVTHHNKPRTQREFVRIVEKHIRPALGSHKVAGVTRADVAKLHGSMAETPRLANLALSVLSKAFALAEVWSLRPDASNPARLIKRFPERRRERFCTDEELGRLGAVLIEVERERSVHPSAINAIRLLALTGCRMGEIISLRWNDVDADTHQLVIRDAKAGGRRQTVGNETIGFLVGLDRYDGCPWVLPHTDLSKHIPDYTLEKAWRRIRNMAALEDVRLHDLRHTVGTYAGQTGANAFLIRDKLGHTSTAMTGQYVNHAHAPVRQLSDKVEGRVVAALQSGTVSGGEVR